MYGLIAKHACGVWCEMWVDFNCFRHKSSVMILAISMLYTQRWHEILEGGGYNFERSMHYECFCAYVKSQMGIYIWFTMLLKVSFLHILWLGCLTWNMVYISGGYTKIKVLPKKKKKKRYCKRFWLISIQYQKAVISNKQTNK